MASALINKSAYSMKCTQLSIQDPSIQGTSSHPINLEQPDLKQSEKVPSLRLSENIKSLVCTEENMPNPGCIFPNVQNLTIQFIEKCSPIRETTRKEVSLDFLRFFPNLQSLSLIGNNHRISLSKEDYVKIRDLKFLKELDLGAIEATEENLNLLGINKALESLKIGSYEGAYKPERMCYRNSYLPGIIISIFPNLKKVSFSLSCFSNSQKWVDSGSLDVFIKSLLFLQEIELRDGFPKTHKLIVEHIEKNHKVSVNKDPVYTTEVIARSRQAFGSMHDLEDQFTRSCLSGHI